MSLVEKRRLVGLLEPGGIAAFDEFDFGLALACANSELAPTWGRRYLVWTVEALKRAGVRVSMGLELYSAFLQADLASPTMSVFAPLAGADDRAIFELGAEGQRSMLPLYEHYGIATAEEVDVETLAERSRADVLATRRPAILAPHVCAWARKRPA